MPGPAAIVRLEDDQARLAEIDENLIRNELTGLEIGELLVERTAILSRIGVRAERGAQPGNQNASKNEGETVSPSFETTADMAASVGLSERSAQQLMQAARDIAPDVRRRHLAIGRRLDGFGPGGRLLLRVQLCQRACLPLVRWQGLCAMAHIVNRLCRVDVLIGGAPCHPPPRFAVILESLILLSVEAFVAVGRSLRAAAPSANLPGMNPDSTVPAPCAHPDRHPTVTLTEYAALAGLSVRTVRERARRGEVPAWLEKGRHGLEYRLRHPDCQPNRTVPVTLPEDFPHPDSTVTAPSADGLGELVSLVERQQQTILELSGRCGYLQSELAHARDRIALLEAPPEAIAASPIGDTPPAPHSADSGSERAIRPSWWKRVLTWA